MRHINKERIKSIVLIALFVISLIQVGILWSKQSHRFPISFLAGIFSRPQVPVSDEMTRDELFIPYRLIISKGELSHWIIDRKDPVYQPFWDEVKTYLTDIARGNLTPTAAGSDRWGDITSKKGFVFEFKTGIGPDLLKWFLGVSNSSAEHPVVHKIMIIPDSSDDSINSMYIYDTSGKVYKYLPAKYKRAKGFTEILAIFEDGNQAAYREYITMHDTNSESKLNVVPDALYAVSGRGWPYSTISCSVPGSLGNKDQVAVALLGEYQKERYEQREYDDGTIQFSIKENLYKIHPGGILEYKNFSEADSGTGENIGAALRNAYSFIKKAVSLTGSTADIYLSGLVPQNGIYKFSFDYMINGYPVYIDLASAGSGGKEATNAVTIEANSKRVLYCLYIIRDFAVGNKNSYNDRFMDIMAEGDIFHDQVQIKDMGVGYVISSIEDKQLVPYMVLENKGEPALIIKKLPEQKGD